MMGSKMAFPNLFKPLDIGSVTVKNRLMTAAHSHDFWKFDPERYHRWNKFSERAKLYHVDRAKGGWGLITMGQVSVHPSCGTTRPTAFLDEVADEYRPITDAIHEHGAKVFVQMNHVGRGRTSGTDDWHPSWATTPGLALFIPGQGPGGEFSKEIEVSEIHEVVEGFARSARNMQKAGFDGIEIQASHSYLVAEFLTPAHNKRNDQYGGSLENRMRFLTEIIDAVREAVGSEYTVGVRHNCEWRMPEGGFTLEDSIEVARRLEAGGKVDFLNLTGWPNSMSMAGTGTPHGVILESAAKVKEAVPKLPTFVVGRIVDPAMAEQIVAEGKADMVAMARASIADPEFPNKAREGRPEDIRQCIGASQGCLVRHMMKLPITCTQNPTVGREGEWGLGTLKPATRKKKVLIVGGGPAGLEAAVTAAQRGHAVTLCELGSDLGGQVNLIVRNPRRTEFINVVDYRRRLLDKLGIEVRLNTAVTPEFVTEFGADAVVVATGSAPYADNFDLAIHWSPSNKTGTGIAGGDQPHVFTSWDVLHGATDGLKNVVLFDGIGYYQSSDVLEYLVAKGSKVTAVAAGGVFGEDLPTNDRPLFLNVIRGKDVTFHQFTTVKEILKESVLLVDNQRGRELTIDGIDGVVLSMGNAPRNALYHALEGKVGELHRIGDCVTPRRIEHAHFEGHKLGREL